MPVKNEFFEIQFYIKNKDGVRITDYLRAYILSPYAYDAVQMLIATYANGDEKKIWHTSPKTFGIEEKMKSLNYYDFRFQIINEKKQRVGRDMHDIIISDHWRHAEQILIGKYADGDKSRISYSLLRSYKYDELHNLNTLRLDTYDFYFYLKDEKGKQITKNLHYYVDSWNYWEAQEKFLAAVAGGDKTKVWFSTGRNIGPALPTILKQEYEAEKERKKELERKLKQQEREDRIKESEIKRQREKEELERELEQQALKEKRKEVEAEQGKNDSIKKTSSPSNYSHKKNVDSEADSKVEEGMKLLKESKFTEAYKIFKEVTKKNGQNGKAFMGLVMAHNKCQEPSDLTKKHLDISDDNFTEFICFTDDEEIGEIASEVLANEEDAIMKDTEEFLDQFEKSKESNAPIHKNNTNTREKNSEKKYSEVEKPQKKTRKKKSFLKILFKIFFLYPLIIFVLGAIFTLIL